MDENYSGFSATERVGIAGPHDSATTEVTSLPIFKDIVETQILGFDKQLEYGIA